MAINAKNPILFDTQYALSNVAALKFFETSSGNSINAPDATYTAIVQRIKDAFETNMENGRTVLQQQIVANKAFLELISGDDGTDLDTIRDHKAFLRDSLFVFKVADTEVVTVPCTMLTPMTYAEYTGVVSQGNTGVQLQSMAATRGMALDLGGILIPANTKFSGEIKFRTPFTAPSAKVMTARLILSAK